MLNKIKEWIKEYALLIIAVLIVTIMVKSCSASSDERYYAYNVKRYEYTIDSLTRTINDNRDTIYILRNENSLLRENIIDIQRDKEHYRKANNNLVNVTKSLSDKQRDTI
jgi:predicted RNase H-like nuclease (RuvC/YqgF family)